MRKHVILKRIRSHIFCFLFRISRRDTSRECGTAIRNAYRSYTHSTCLHTKYYEISPIPFPDAEHLTSHILSSRTFVLTNQHSYSELGCS